MIDVEQRAYALEIAQTGKYSGDIGNVHEKAVIYGVLAFFADHMNLSAAREELKVHSTATIRDNIACLRDILFEQVNAIVADQPKHAEALSELMTDRWGRYSLGQHNKITTAARLKSGIGTAMDAEAMSLHTIQYRVKRLGQSITLRGLLDSQRVPFAIAMEHLSRGNIANTDQTRYEVIQKRFGCVVKELVFKDEIVTLDKHKGLMVTGELPKEYNISTLGTLERMAQEPQIGCPVTLIRGFIRDLHSIAAEAAVENGAIPLAEE